MAADTLHVVRTYATTLEAELAKSFLESSGMTALVSADDCGGMRPHLQAKGVALLVHADDLGGGGGGGGGGFFFFFFFFFFCCRRARYRGEQKSVVTR